MLFRPRSCWLLAAGVFTALPVLAQDAERIGLTALRRERPAITGSGVPVAQPEGNEAAGAWQVSPAVNPSITYTWSGSAGTASTFPNAVGSASAHANAVGQAFFGSATGVAPGIPRVDSYEALYYITGVVGAMQSTPAQVVNQSFYSDTAPLASYDAYAATYNVLFVSGMNNIPDTPHPPATSYNGIGVGILSPNAQSSVGPTSDGRAKPDLVAPHSCCSSFTTPLVAGGAALLLQAARANDAGPGTAALATNITVIKALLLNGAVKTTNWTNGVTRPLDARYGAGVLNIYNSDVQLRGGRHRAQATNSSSLNSTQPLAVSFGRTPSLRGWDLSDLSSTVMQQRATHYYFDLASEMHSATATLTWKKGSGALANLDLFLYDTASGMIVASSVSTVDNVEHIFIPDLPPGRYALQVLKRGGVGQANTEAYALAFDFTPVRPTIARSGANVLASWPASPAGYILQSAESVAPAQWQAVTGQSLLSNGFNTVLLPANSSARYFRLARP